MARHDGSFLPNRLFRRLLLWVLSHVFSIVINAFPASRRTIKLKTLDGIFSPRTDAMIKRSTLQHPRRRALGVILLVALFLAGCSSTRLAYRQLDWLLVWWVEDYIPLNDAQEARLETQINSLLDWHCQNELPRYTAWLEDVKAQATQPPLDVSEVEARQTDLFNALDRLMRAIHPTATQLLASLDSAQVKALAQAMADSQQERRDEFVGESPEDQLQKREERTRERAERWLGRLTPSQQDALASWNRSRGNQTTVWLEGRGRWQQALLQSLDNRDAADFPQRIEYLLVNSSAVRGEEYQTMLAESQVAMAQLISDLINQSTPEQRDHLEAEIEELQADFESLTCRSGEAAPEKTGA